MSNLDIPNIKTVLKQCISAVKEDQELKTLFAELMQIVSTKNILPKQSETALINPITLAGNEGINRLVEELEKMEVKQIIMIIKQYGLDPTKKSYTWKNTPENKKKRITLIRDKINGLLTKGDVFLGNQ